MRIVIATDKFKGSLSATEAAHSLSRGIKAVSPEAVIEEIPIADGGEGTLDAAITAGFTRHLETVSGPTGQPVRAAYATRGHKAVIELAQASGLALLPGMTLDPLGATSFGTGQLVQAALNRGCTEIIIGAGGSASTDGGAGLLAALGAEFLDADGSPVAMGGGALREIASVNLDGLDHRAQSARFVLASDVDHPLLGLHGAAAVFGPQKGANEHDIKKLEGGLAHFAQMLETEIGPRSRDATAAPGAGSAGGVGYGLMAALGARRESGVELVHQLTNFEHRLEGADLLISGEGRLDHQSLGGKAAVGTAKAAMARGVPVIAVCGSTSLTSPELQAAGISRAYSLRDLEPNLQRCLENASSLLETTGRILAEDLRYAESTRGSQPPATQRHSSGQL
ncbi:glycerate kinase [Pseudarthrobacter enclensis]|uniref:Glycerate kinase n=1 Tax=Pseudarthrobacter enclensis TaxID=993070 RepID=A0ABT9RV21_9MICC|nr:glycerate kinase [Pseudarthrobacter enclensis]MDP9889080.1 glycerate kinase [Pseudarthrobacter enclensis]